MFGTRKVHVDGARVVSEQHVAGGRELMYEREHGRETKTEISERRLVELQLSDGAAQPA